MKAPNWNESADRLDREFGRKRWGDEGYAMEELVAELGAAFLCAGLELTPELRDDHASYLANWLTVLRATSGRSSPPPRMRSARRFPQPTATATP